MSRPASENFSTEGAFGVGRADTAPVLELAAFYDLPNLNPHTAGAYGRAREMPGLASGGHTDPAHAGRDAHSAKQQ
jgi:hypothetical protein